MLIKLKCLVIFTILLPISLANNCRISETKASGYKAARGPYCAGQMIFQDEFQQLDFGNWQHEITLGGGGNWEFQWYTNNRSNSFTKNGALHIRPTLTSDIYGEQFLTSGRLDINADGCTNAAWYGCSRQGTTTHIVNPVRSARLRTKDSFNFKYGKVEIRAKLPSGDWLWPAIWLLPKDDVYGTWPSSGEIDIMESRGNRDLSINGVNIGVEQVGSTLHYGPNPNFNGWEKAHVTKNSNRGQGFNKDFHVYSLEWTPNHIKFFLDGAEVKTINADNGFFKKGGFPESINNPWKHNSKMAPFDQEFHIILNLAVGGTNGYFPDIASNPTPKPWSNQSPHGMTDFWNGRSNWLPTWDVNNRGNEDLDFQIDYVRVYAL